MKIQLILKDDYDTILEIQKKYPVFTFQNVGYQYIDKSKFNEEEKEMFEYISDILRQHVVGFSEFNNFCHDKDGNIRIRLHYNYGAEDNTRPFTGVGYLLLDELLNGFDKL